MTQEQASVIYQNKKVYSLLITWKEWACKFDNSIRDRESVINGARCVITLERTLELRQSSLSVLFCQKSESPLIETDEPRATDKEQYAQHVIQSISCSYKCQIWMTCDLPYCFCQSRQRSRCILLSPDINVSNRKKL